MTLAAQLPRRLDSRASRLETSQYRSASTAAWLALILHSGVFTTSTPRAMVGRSAGAKPTHHV